MRKGGFTYFSFPIFSCYHRVGAVAMLEIAEKLIADTLGGPKMVATSLPRAGRVTIRHQPDQNRDIVHLLHATPALRGQFRNANVQPIQDLTTLRDVAVTLSASGALRSVRLVPSGEELAFSVENDRISFVVPSVTGHQMVEVRYWSACHCGRVRFKRFNTDRAKSSAEAPKKIRCEARSETMRGEISSSAGASR